MQPCRLFIVNCWKDTDKKLAETKCINILIRTGESELLLEG